MRANAVQPVLKSMEQFLGSAGAAPDSGPLTAKYTIRRRLGEGGFGEVYEAWDATLCRRVALKKLKPGTVQAPHQLLDEARRAASLGHTAFVKIFSVEEREGPPFIVMELVDGGTLTQAIGGQAMPPATALSLVRQVAEAMAEAHDAHLVHGDLKPSNLMLDHGNRVRILDFGLARHIDPLSTQSTAVSEQHGTIAYMAPERLLGAASDVASDIYALGVVLYEAINGQRPFAQLKGLGLAAAQLQSDSASWPFAPSLEAGLVALVRAMSSKNPAARPVSMHAVCAAIDALTAGNKPAPVRRIHLVRDTLRRAWPRRGVLHGLLGASLLALAVWFASPSVILAKAGWATPVASRMAAGMDALRYADRDGSVDAAIGHFQSILDHTPQHAGAAAGLSLAYSLRYFSDQRDEAWLRFADASAQAALRADDQLALAHAALGWVRQYQGKMDEAVACARHALRLDPGNLFALRGAADVLIRMHRFGDAEEVIAQARQAHPKERLFLDLLGKLRFQQADYRAAEAAFRQSIALEPDAVYAYANLNAALLRQNRNDEALRVIQQGLGIRPNSRLYGNLGTALFARGDYQGAAQAFEQAVSAGKGNPGQYLNWANLADTLRWLPGRADASRQAYQRAAGLLAPLLERAPHDTTYLSQMGLYRAKLGEQVLAAELSSRAVLAAPDSADVHFRAAMAYEIAGNRPQALAHLLQARKLGYPQNLIDSEPDLIALRREPGYLHLTRE